jgi:glycyl-tRNA synthetase
VAQGNEHVLRARFADAEYFIRRDLERPLETYRADLETLTFQAKLGSMLDKTERVTAVVRDLNDRLAAEPEERSHALRAAELCKADLATKMVVEMTSLQGDMGREYALRAGEATEVAEAIREHYLPRYAGDHLPASKPGTIVGLADRLDTLMGLFAIGMQPTGARDPFALRRAAIGLIQILVAHDVDLDLRQALLATAKTLPVKVTDEALEACLRFIATRHQTLLLSEGHAHDAVEAVLAAQSHTPARAQRAVRDLEARRAAADWALVLQAFARCARISRSEKTVFDVDPALFQEQAEIELGQAVTQAETHPRTRGSVADFFGAFEPLVPAITRFFEDVLVMAEDPKLRQNRLGLVQRIVALSADVVDLSHLEGF